MRSKGISSMKLNNDIFFLEVYLGMNKTSDLTFFEDNTILFLWVVFFVKPFERNLKKYINL